MKPPTKPTDQRVVLLEMVYGLNKALSTVEMSRNNINALFKEREKRISDHAAAIGRAIDTNTAADELFDVKELITPEIDTLFSNPLADLPRA